MALVPYVPFEDFLEEEPSEAHSSRIFIHSPPVVGPPGPAGPAGVPTSLGHKNVKAYGATGVGIVNDTAAINAAIAAAYASNSAREVFFPPGLYKVMAPGIRMYPGVRLKGLSRLSSTLIAGANDVVLVNAVATTLANGFDIQDLGFSAGGFSGVTGVFLDGEDASKRFSLIQIKDLYFNCNTGLRLRFCANVLLQSCFANACHDGFILDNVADAVLHDCHAQNGSGYGFLVQGGEGASDEGIKLTNCTTNGQAYGINVIGQDWGQMVGCSFTTCTGGPVVLAGSTNWRINTTDIAAAYPVAGLVLDANCSHIQISDCFVALNSFGIVIAGSKIGIRGCHFEQNSNVDIYTLAVQSVISSNICNSNGIGVSILEYTPADFNVIQGNLVNGTIVIVGGSTSDTNNLPF